MQWFQEYSMSVFNGYVLHPTWTRVNVYALSFPYRCALAHCRISKQGLSSGGQVFSTISLTETVAQESETRRRRRNSRHMRKHSSIILYTRAYASGTYFVHNAHTQLGGGKKNTKWVECRVTYSANSCIYGGYLPGATERSISFINVKLGSQAGFMIFCFNFLSYFYGNRVLATVRRQKTSTLN